MPSKAQAIALNLSFSDWQSLKEAQGNVYCLCYPLGFLSRGRQIILIEDLVSRAVCGKHCKQPSLVGDSLWSDTKIFVETVGGLGDLLQQNVFRRRANAWQQANVFVLGTQDTTVYYAEDVIFTDDRGGVLWEIKTIAMR